ncbi:12820_t:CDS:2 [Acaulospora colombiana]|uniref:12820_t:CDS:1 n=1 Tax=Acaulospora colombiana TaxID=27376 RepID=A0ACA9L800_9GLOM|nr:12820_t:CDS:2 [Acaulospora colombiana]
MSSEIKENEIDASDEVTHLEFVRDRASASSKNIALLENFLKSTQIARSYPYLESLNVRGNQDIMVTPYVKLLNLAKNHAIPILAFAGNINDDFLEHLDIGACDASDASISIHNIAQHCSNMEFLSILGINIIKDALSKLNSKIKIKRSSTFEMDPEKELDDLRTSLVYLAQDLWST